MTRTACLLIETFLQNVLTYPGLYRPLRRRLLLLPLSQPPSPRTFPFAECRCVSGDLHSTLRMRRLLRVSAARGDRFAQRGQGAGKIPGGSRERACTRDSRGRVSSLFSLLRADWPFLMPSPRLEAFCHSGKWRPQRKRESDMSYCAMTSKQPTRAVSFVRSKLESTCVCVIESHEQRREVMYTLFSSFRAKPLGCSLQRYAYPFELVLFPPWARSGLRKIFSTEPPNPFWPAFGEASSSSLWS